MLKMQAAQFGSVPAARLELHEIRFGGFRGLGFRALGGFLGYGS